MPDLPAIPNSCLLSLEDVPMCLLLLAQPGLALVATTRCVETCDHREVAIYAPTMLQVLG